MTDKGREWRSYPAAMGAAIVALQAASPAELPASYLKFLSGCDGGEGPLPVQPYWLCLDPAEVVAETYSKDAYGEFFTGFMMIGSNGGGEFVAFDMRGGSPWPVVAIDMTNSDLDQSVLRIADDFDSFLSLIDAH
jgi:hypothetical protein